jgi:hypothetical protein
VAHNEREKAIKHFLKVHHGIRGRASRYRDHHYDEAIERLAAAHLARMAARRKWRAIWLQTPQPSPQPKLVK